MRRKNTIHSMIILSIIAVMFLSSTSSACWPPPSPGPCYEWNGSAWVYVGCQPACEGCESCNEDCSGCDDDDDNCDSCDVCVDGICETPCDCGCSTDDCEACDPETDYCRSTCDDATCQHCVDGICEERCEEANCEVCDGSGQCVPKSCPPDHECILGICQPLAGGGPCIDTSDCPDDLFCLNGTCTPEGDDCDPACGVDENCVNGQCIPDDGGGVPCDPPCPQGEVCLEGECVPDDDTTCDPACKDYEVCANGMCVPVCDPACRSSSCQVCDVSTAECVACLEDQTCVAGECRDNCTNDSDCDTGAGEVCRNGVCVTSCTTDEDCRADEECINGICQPKDGGGLCETDDDCGPDESCSPNGICQADEGGGACTTDDDCQPGFSCSPNGICQSDDGGGDCETDDDCLEDHTCVNGTCQPDEGGGDCETDADCPPDQMCIEGTCVSDDGDCTFPCDPGFRCVNGDCIPDGSGSECTVNANCDAGEICVDGHCVPDGPPGCNECTVNADCATGQICVNTCCEPDDPPPPGGCNTKDDCDANEDCVNGQCVPSTTCTLAITSPDENDLIAAGSNVTLTASCPDATSFAWSAVWTGTSNAAGSFPNGSSGNSITWVAPCGSGDVTISASAENGDCTGTSGTVLVEVVFDAEVDFREYSGQKYGYDDYSGQAYTPPYDYKSVKVADTDKAWADINPEEIISSVTFSSVNTNIVTVAPLQATSSQELLDISGVSEDFSAVEALAGDCWLNEILAMSYFEDEYTLAVVSVHENDDDVQVFPLSSNPGPNVVCVGAGNNLERDTIPLGDDVISGENITTGPDGICQTVADNSTDIVPTTNSFLVKDYLNRIYKQAVVKWTDVAFFSESFVNYDLDCNGIIDRFSTTETGRVISQCNALNPNLANYNAVIYIVIPDPTVGGFAYMGSDEAFVFDLNLEIWAHELGHAVFSLTDLYNDPLSSDTQNLMYHGEKLRYNQWIGIQARKPQP